MSQPTWQQIAQKAQAERDAGIPAKWRIPADELAACGDHGGPALIEKHLSEREKEITGVTAKVALEKLASGEWTCVEVTDAICHRTALAHQITNCCTELFFPRALARAAELDAAFKANGNKPTGPFHGLPVSLKDDQDLRGTKTTWGFVAWHEPLMEGDSAVVRILSEAGAVFYCKTNVPQALMTFESANPLWGHVMNVHNRALGAGGSSGGEGCIVSCLASYLGVGTDIGGSIRLPASINGVYGLKPSARRLAYCDSRAMAQGSPELIAPVNGPLARSIDDLALFCELIVRDGTKHDSEAIPLPWTPVTLTTKLKIGYFIDTELFRATPPVRRAMNQTLRALEAAGHELVPFPVTDGSEILTLATQIFGAFSENIHAVLASTGEPLIEGLKWMVNSLPTASAADMWDYFIRRQQIRKRYLARMLDLDGLVCPTIGIPTVPHHRSGDAIPACVYTIMFNLLDYSAGVVPVTSTTESDVVPPDFVPAEGIEASIYNVYDPVVFKGAPVGIQVVGKRLQEEKVLAMMKVVDAAVKAAAN